LHLRPSGNAPELRPYVEAETANMAADLLERGLSDLRRDLKPGKPG
jgi:phosphomannomutase